MVIEWLLAPDDYVSNNLVGVLLVVAALALMLFLAHRSARRTPTPWERPMTLLRRSEPLPPREEADR